MFREEAPLRDAAGKDHAVGRTSGSRTVAILMDPRLIAWNAMLLLLGPVLLLMKLRRYQKKHAPQEFSSCRWSVESRLLESDKLGPHVVFVAASYGEVVLVKRITAELRSRAPDLRTTWAIRDPVTYREVAARQRDQSIVVQPFDSAIPVIRWLHTVNPDVVVMMERYNFPHLVASSRHWGSKVILVNGRAKGAYQRAGGLVRSYYRWVFGSYDSLHFQSAGDLEKAAAVAPATTRLTTTGNIKLDLPAADISEERMELIRSWLQPGGSPLIAAGSTDELDEDRFVLDAFEMVRRTANCRLLLAPRSLDRPSSLKEEITRRGFTFSFRSSMDPVADVHVLDTMGELTYVYKLTAGAYVGGFLSGMGHNVIEPLAWGVPVSYGPRRGHFSAMQRLCEAAGVGFRVSTPDELAAFWDRALTDSTFLAHVKEQAQSMLSSQRSALDETVDVILDAAS